MPRKKRHEYTLEEMVGIARQNPDCKWPFFQFYPDNFEGSNPVKMMGLAGAGAYMFLLCAAWKEDDCGLPPDDESLAALSRAGAEWGKHREKILRCFKEVDGRLYNPKLLYCRVDSNQD